MSVSPVSINPTAAQLSAKPTQNTLSNSDLGDRLSKPATTLNSNFGASLVMLAPVTQKTGTSSTLHQGLADAQQLSSDTAAETLGKATDRIHEQREEDATTATNTQPTLQKKPATAGIEQPPLP